MVQVLCASTVWNHLVIPAGDTPVERVEYVSPATQPCDSPYRLKEQAQAHNALLGVKGGVSPSCVCGLGLSIGAT